MRAIDAAWPVTVRRKPGAEGAPARLEVAIEGRDPRTFEAVRRQPVGPEELAALQGEYVCEELKARRRVAAKKDRLVLEGSWHGPGAPEVKPINADLYLSDAGLMIEVVRDGDGVAQALRVSTPRARNLLVRRA
jgi:hypothetical protein